MNQAGEDTVCFHWFLQKHSDLGYILLNTEYEKFTEPLILGKVRRPSRNSTHREANMLWRSLSSIIEPCLTHSEPHGLDPVKIDEIYTTDRISPDYKAARNDRVRQLPIEWRNITPEQAGEIEAIVLYWLTQQDVSQNILCLTGPRGVGKSSLVHYVFRALIPSIGAWQDSSCISNSAFSVIIDLRALTSPTPSVSQIISLVDNAITQSLSICHFVNPCTPDPNPTAPQGSHDEIALISNMLKKIPISHFLNGVKTLIRPVLIFDNCDKLSPRSVDSVLRIARSVAILFGIKTIIPARPWTRNNYQYRSFVLGEFVVNSLTVDPPDLNKLLQRRFESQIRSLSEQKKFDSIPPLLLSGGVHVDIKNYNYLLSSIADFFIHADVQEHVLQNLCNYDARNALIAIRSILRYKDLPINEFIDFSLLGSVGYKSPRPTKRSGSHISTSKQNKRRRSVSGYNITRAVMRDDYSLYRENTQSGQNIVFNLFDIGLESHQFYAVQYKVLSHLMWRGDAITIRECADAIGALGYSSSICELAIKRLFVAGLLDSPESDEDFSAVHLITLSVTGEYYLSVLASDADYIYECLADTPLPHSEWDKPNLASRMASWHELIQLLFTAERAELGSLKSNSADYGHLLSPEPDLLTFRVVDGAREYLSRQSVRRRPKNQDTLHRYGHIFGKISNLTLIESAAQSKSSIDQYLHILDAESNRLYNKCDNAHVSTSKREIAIGESLTASIEYPALLKPKKIYSIRIELQGDGPIAQEPIYATIVYKNAMTPTNKVDGKWQGHSAWMGLLPYDDHAAQINLPVRSIRSHATNLSCRIQLSMHGKLIGSTTIK